MTRQYTARFHHTNGGDGLLPKAHRGYYNGFSVIVCAKTEAEAEVLAMSAMHNDRFTNNPDFIDRAVDDLSVILEDRLQPQEKKTMNDTAKCPNPLGPIPEWVRERWQGDKPYPEQSLAEKNTQAGEKATNRRAARELAENVPDFERSATYERIYIDRSGGVYRLHSRDTVDAIFSSRTMAASYLYLHGYRRLFAHDTATKFAYDREPNV